MPFLTRGTICPDCRASDQWRYHGQYSKYHRWELLTILRVSCSCSKKTHAIMPSFSLPHCSLDVNDLDSYLLARSGGICRREAVSLVPGMAYCSYRSLVRLERRKKERFAQLRSLLTESVPTSGENPELPNLALSGVSVSSMNRYCLTRHGRGWFCGNPGWLGRRTKAGMALSHDLQSILTMPQEIDSS